MNPLKQISELGQAIWLDDIHRDLMTSGKLKRMIDEDDLRGMTSNPAIFHEAITNSSDYEEEIHTCRQAGKSAKEIFETLAVKDVQIAADVFRPLYDSTDGVHGYVSIEVNPHLARDPVATIEDGWRLWESVARPNVFIKVPATTECLPAISELLSEGINVNVTLLFGLPRYAEVAEAFMTGLENRVAEGKSISKVRSVASFFLSRIDVLLDLKLEKIVQQGGGKGELARKMRGEVAISSAKSAYQIYREIIDGDRWRRLAGKGAQPQWLLWASTSTKNPDYSDVKYIEPLIGPETINTAPMETLDAYRDHGRPQSTLEQDIEHARRVMAQLSEVGLEIDDATKQLEEEGVEKFCKPFDALLETLAKDVATA